MIQFLLIAALLFLPVAGKAADSHNKPPAKTASSDSKPAPLQAPISGTVVQTMNSGGYSYILLKKQGDEKIWMAIPQAKVTTGESMTIKPGMEMANFQSKSLNRTFDKIIFSEGTVATKGAKEGKKEETRSPGSKGAVIAAGEKIKVAKAAGANAYTIAELYKLKAKLNNKKIAVKGKVVKVSAGIMSKNWIHLQDGSGDPKKGNNDLVVTSQSLPSVGEVVTATGVFYKDKDFGGGYKYAVIIEQTEIAAK